MENENKIKKVKLKIKGMHCASCELLIERELSKINGVREVKADQAMGTAQLRCAKRPSLSELNQAVNKYGYTVFDPSLGNIPPASDDKKEHLETGAIFLIVVAGYFILRGLKLAPEIAISDTMSYGFVFLLGLTAAVSTCIAVTGGLLLACAARYSKQNPNLSGVEKFKPFALFNVGRIASYTLLGGLLGSFGSFFSYSPSFTGFVTMVVSVVMLILGLQILGIFPLVSKLQPKIPKFIGHKIEALNENGRLQAPFVLGALTFFLPCGFTQALQLYVLTRGSFAVGAITMFMFSLGTLPALMSLGVISSFVKGRVHGYFLKFSGAVVVLLGLFNFNNGMVLTGVSLNLPRVTFDVNHGSEEVLGSEITGEIINGVQVIKMRIEGLEYYPSKFTIYEGVPVEWWIDSSKASGCAKVITVPKLGITKYLPPDKTESIKFTPNGEGSLAFSCSMGMTTRGSQFTVIKKPDSLKLETGGKKEDPENQCNSQLADCLPVPKISMKEIKVT